MKKTIAILVALLIAAMVLVSGCAEAPEEVPEDIIDNVTEDAEDMEEELLEDDIVDTAMGSDSFDTLVTAVQEVGLVDTLKGEGPFTVFAPTDTAFEALPEGVLDALLADEEALTAILTYHVVAGEYMAEDLSDGMALETVQGQDIVIDTTDGVMVNDANVVQADVEASNGVIHAIDQVILPPEHGDIFAEADCALCHE